MNMREEKSKQKTPLWKSLKNWARSLKRDIMALYFALKHPRTPLYTKVAAAVVVGYALSPLDLIPDFIPVLGYLDDVILLPLGIALVIRLLPRDILDFCRRQVAENPLLVRPKIWAVAFIFVVCWLLVAYWAYQALDLDFLHALEERLWDWVRYTGDDFP